jgi:hypothetical protein
MFGWVPPAFIRARVAKASAQIAEVAHELGVAGERFGGKPAQRCTVEVETHTLFHFWEAPFSDARRRAIPACRCTTVERAHCFCISDHVEISRCFGSDSCTNGATTVPAGDTGAEGSLCARRS